MKMLPKYLLRAAIVALMITAYSWRPIIGEVTADSSKYIEVCSYGIVYVPPETKFVTCQGKVMRVIAIVSGGVEARLAPNCYCPRCCDGACAVTVSCGGGGLCTIYLTC
jgi:hypothetical protein